MSLSERIDRLFEASCPARPAAIARILVGTAVAAKAVYCFVTIAPRFELDVMYFPFVSWTPRPTFAGITAMLAVWFAAAVAFAAGFRTRLAGSVVAAAIACFVILDQQFYSNHLYLLFLLVLLLTVADSGATLSIDARRRGERRLIPAWPLTLLRWQLSIVYGYAVIAKLNPEFLAGLIVYENWLGAGLLPLPEPLRRAEFVVVLALGAVHAELFLTFAFWSDRLLRAAIAIGIAMHASMVLTMGDVVELTIFAVSMFSMYLLFLPGARPIPAVAAAR